MKCRSNIVRLCWISLLFLSALAQASVVLSGTRVVYQAADAETTVRMNNTSEKTPALIQAWIDKGDTKAAPDEIDVPFVITPTIARIDPGKGQALRIVYIGNEASLPADRESVFWLNVVEIPPKPTADNSSGNVMQFAFRTRIKMFYRPSKLDGHIEQASNQLTWRLKANDKTSEIEVINPTAYHISFSEIEVLTGDKKAATVSGGMVAPKDKKTFSLDGLIPANASYKIRYTVINDSGANIEGESHGDSRENS